MLFRAHRIFSYCPSKPRSPLLKLLVGVLGLALLLVLVAVGLVVGLGMLLFAAVRRLMRPRPVAATRVDAGVIEGEFVEVRKSGTPLHLR